MNKDILTKTVARLLLSSKGILAIDESLNTCNKRFEKLGIPTSEEKRREYRELLITAPEIEKYISGYILFDETIKQNTKDDRSFISVLQSKGIEIGIKVDTGTSSFSLNFLEKITEGLDGLKERLIEYAKLGAKFAKWRAVITIGQNIPTDHCIEANAEALAKYAFLCQEQDIVPMVEPEVLMDADNTIQICKDATNRTLKALFAKLAEHNVPLEGLILKTNMVISGKKCPVQASAQEVAHETVETFLNVVPKELPGIVFLSGGQTPDQATENLAEINKIAGSPWQLSFSYGRALQDEALMAWGGKDENVEAGQKAFIERVKKVSEARSQPPS